MIYPLIRPLLFTLDAEQAHEASLELLKQFRFLVPKYRCEKPVEVMGLTFLNPLGLAAGLDKNGEYLPGLERLGFGFIEIGTITPKPQPGNPKPRLFRLPEHRSIINRMGFNNAGVDYLLEQVKGRSRDYQLGINIGKNLSTPVEQALDDYCLAMRAVYTSADYVTVNISSPNTPGLRALQSEDALRELLSGLAEERKRLQDETGENRPLVLKVAPDLADEAVAPIGELLIENSIDGLIVSNTTLDRAVVAGHPLAEEAGGLSGEALTLKSRDMLVRFHDVLQDAVPIISVGGIASAEEARLRLELGAKLVQIYSGLIFHGPGLVKTILRGL